MESMEVQMAALTIKNIPDELYQKLKASAKRNHRSLNSELIACMEKVLNSERFDQKQFLAEVREMRKKLEVRGVYLTEEFLRDAKESGRE